jgi:transcription initiation factor TFIID subunit 2
MERCPGMMQCRRTEIVVAGGNGMHLHAYELDILSIHVDGVPASFDYRKDQAVASDEAVEGGEVSIKDLYISVLERDLEPELYIQFPPLPAENDSDRNIVICYQVCNPQAGVYFEGYVPKDKGEESLYPTGYAVVDNTIRRTSAWVPCVDVPSFGKEVEFNLGLTVRDSLIAVGPGRLVKQTYSEQNNCDNFKWKTFWYEIPNGASPCDLGFAIGPFSVESSSNKLLNGGSQTIATYFAPKDVSSGSGLQHAAKMFGVIQSLYAEVLGVDGIPSHVQTVFLPVNVSRNDCEVFSGLSVLSTSSLCNVTSVEQSQRARLEQAWALARQWFGQFVRPATPGDVWLVEGLAAWLQEQFIRKYMGRTEVAIRRWDRRLAVAAADNGTAAPLFIPFDEGPNTWRSSWGRLYGTERVDPSPLRSLKSAAVVAALERRAGEDLFRKHVESIFRNNNGKARTRPSVVWLDATSFVMELGRAGDFRKEVGAFLERWVYGSGVSHIKAGYRFHRRGCYLELGIIQNGSAAALEAAQAAEKAAAFEGIGTGVIKVAVKEGSGALVEHPVHVGAQPFVVAELKVNPEVKKVALKRGRKRKDEEEQLAAQQKAAENAMHPVQWVRLDPGGEWLCAVQVMQPFRTLKNQLNDSKDVVAQLQAVIGMMDISLGGSNPEVVGALLEALNNDQFHWRVRSEAASVLSKLGNEGGVPVGLAALLEYYKSRYWDVDAETGEETVKTTRFSDVSEYLLAQAIVRAVAQATKSTRWQNVSEAAELLLSAVLTIKMSSEEYHSGWTTFSDSGMLSALCEALGDIRVPKADEEELGEIIARIAYLQLRRRLAMELVLPSPEFEVGCSCLQALVASASSKACPSDVVSEVAAILESYSNNLACPTRLRQTAIRCLIRLYAVYNGLEKAFNFALSYKRLEMGNTRALWEELGFLAPAGSLSLGSTEQLEERIRHINSLLSVKKSLIGAIQSCMDVRLRHLMFIAWSRACGEASALVTGPIDHQMPWLDLGRVVVQGESEVNYQSMAGSLKVKLKVGEKGVSEQDGTDMVVADLKAPVVHHSPPVNIDDTQNVQKAEPYNSLIWSSIDEKIGATVLEATEGVVGTCTDGQTTGDDGLIDGTITSEPQKLKKQIKLKLNK